MVTKALLGGMITCKGYIIELLKKKKLYYWRLKSINGNILAHSEVYSARFSAKKTAKHLAEALDCQLKELDK